MAVLVRFISSFLIFAVNLFFAKIRNDNDDAVAKVEESPPDSPILSLGYIP